VKGAKMSMQQIKWVKFEKRRVGGGKYFMYRDEQVLIVTSYGDILLTNKTYDLLGKPESLELLYDEGGNHIGVKASDTSNKNAYKVQLDARSKSIAGKVAASAFIKEMNLARRDKMSAVFRVTVDSNMKMASFNVNQVPSAV